MPIDDLPTDDETTAEIKAESEADDPGVAEAMMDIDASTDGRRWVKVALEVLSADIATGVELCDAEFRAARVEAARMIARILKAIAPDPIA